MSYHNSNNIKKNKSSVNSSLLYLFVSLFSLSFLNEFIYATTVTSEATNTPPSACDANTPVFHKQLELHESLLRTHGLSSLPPKYYQALNKNEEFQDMIKHQKPLSRIAFASCNNQILSQPLWEPMSTFTPEAYFWLGDAVYLDRSNPFFPFIRNPMPLDHMQKDYDLQQSVEGYCHFRDTTPIFGTWDDHDMGENDADHRYVDKIPAQKMFLDFLGIPSTEYIDSKINKDISTPTTTTTTTVTKMDDILQDYLVEDAHTLRTREGVYSARIFGPEGKRVKIILLDIRYYQDREVGDILGEKQWEFLESEIASSYAPYGTDEYREHGAELIIIGSGIQILSWGKPIAEGWRSFPKSRERILQFVANTSSKASAKYASSKINKTDKVNDNVIDARLPPAVMFWSGDIHYAEFTQTFICSQQSSQFEELAKKKEDDDNADVSLPFTSSSIDKMEHEDNSIWATPMIEVTSSGLTHAWGELPKVSTVPYLGPFIKNMTYTHFPTILKKYYSEMDLSHVHNKNIVSEKSLKTYSLLQEINQELLTQSDNRTNLLDFIHKQGTHSVRLNYASLEFDWESDPTNPLVVVSIRNREGGRELIYPLPFSTLQPFLVSSTPKYLEGISKTDTKDVDSLLSSLFLSPDANKRVLEMCNDEITIRKTPGYVVEVVIIGRQISYVLMYIALFIISLFILRALRTKKQKKLAQLEAEKAEKAEKEQKMDEETNKKDD